MGDSKGIRGRMELEELYLGIPDDSVDLTFQDLADVENKKFTGMETIQEAKSPKHASPLNKLPSLDFNRALQEANKHQHHNLDCVGNDGHKFESRNDHRLHHDVESLHASHGHQHRYNPSHHIHTMETGRAYNDTSMTSMNSMYQETGAKRRRPGIPHSNICAICTTYIYIFKHRCLVCGRVYCRNCVNVAMGEMTEGRKCIQCLGRRFSPRYIQKAGNVGCCSGYPSSVKQAELRWAEKGPRRSGEKAYGQTQSSIMMSRSTTPTRPRHHNTGSPSFVSSISYSPYSPNHHHLPL